jgi:hypothetical protein
MDFFILWSQCQVEGDPTTLRRVPTPSPSLLLHHDLTAAPDWSVVCSPEQVIAGV